MSATDKTNAAAPASMMACASHAPLMYCFKRAPAEHDQVAGIFDDLQKQVEAFDPEIVFIFGPDHYTSLFQSLTPPFTIASSCEAVADIGGHPGRFNVPAATAVGCIEMLAEQGVDVAVSHDLKVDHGISQTLHRIAGGVDRYPTVPVIINTMTMPLPPFHRSRRLGEAVGRYAKSLGKRTLFLASGGLSHNPKVIFPDIGTGEADVTSWQMRGPENTMMSADAWYGRLHDIHHLAAEMFADGRLTGADCCFNESFDRSVIDILQEGRLSDMDHWNNKELIETAGIGSVEVHGWLAAAAAHAEMGGAAPKCDIYVQAVEYGIALGIMHGGAHAPAHARTEPVAA
jgi:2,3-dihydroxyphenylpropionate 1,2-dioxygenase